jgi:hypothetical protein
MSVYSTRLHTDAVIAAIQDLGVTVGDGGGDADGPVQKDLTLPYAVVYAVGATFDGPLSAEDLDADAWPTTQVTFCGQTREQAQWLQDTVRAGLVGQVLAVDGRNLGRVRLYMERPAGRDTSVTPYVWWAVDQYRTFSSPV